MTKIVGIVNLTPDSFSDGGKYFSPEKALVVIEKMILEGADIIDIGAQSTRPGAEIISAEEEWGRLEPVLKKLRDKNFIISVDSFNSKVIEKCLDYNISIINDVNGFRSDEMKKLATSSGKKIIFMHSLTVPADKNITLPVNLNVVETLISWAQDKIKELSAAGIKKENMIFDPGIGFGKTPQQCLDVINNAEKFKTLGVEILIGHSEKSFLTLFTDKPAGQRGEETQRFSRILAEKNVDYIRVHDVAGNKKAIGR